MTFIFIVNKVLANEFEILLKILLNLDLLREIERQLFFNDYFYCGNASTFLIITDTCTALLGQQYRPGKAKLCEWVISKIFMLYLYVTEL